MPWKIHGFAAAAHMWKESGCAVAAHEWKGNSLEG